MTPDERRAAVGRALDRLQAELTAAAPAIGTIMDEGLVTCPAGCTRPSLIPGRGNLPQLCDAVYETRPEYGAPAATGQFRCPSCRLRFTPSDNEQETPK